MFSQIAPKLLSKRLQNTFSIAAIVLLAAIAFNVASQNLLKQAHTAEKTITLHALVSPAMVKTEPHKRKKSGKAIVAPRPADITTAAVMTQVRTTAKRNSVRIQELSTDVRQEQTGNWLMVNIEAKGNYRHIKKMVSAFQEKYNQLRIDTLRMEKVRGGLMVWLKFTPGQVGQDA